jgi:hypothetical protein
MAKSYIGWLTRCGKELGDGWLLAIVENGLLNVVRSSDMAGWAF